MQCWEYSLAKSGVFVSISSLANMAWKNASKRSAGQTSGLSPDMSKQRVSDPGSQGDASAIVPVQLMGGGAIQEEAPPWFSRFEKKMEREFSCFGGID